MPEGGARRGLLRLGLTAPLLAQFPRTAAANTINAVRVWPAREYTRVTLEYDHKPVFSQATLTSPDRLMVDIEEIAPNSRIREIIEKVHADDPYISSVRIGLNRPGVVRVVFDLRQPVRPQIFTLEPVGDYQHRLVIDLHPLVERDPLIALLEQSADIGQDAEDPVVARRRERENAPVRRTAMRLRRSWPTPPTHQSCNRQVRASARRAGAGQRGASCRCAWRRSRSTRAMAARIRVRSAGVARARRPSCSRLHANCRR